MQLPWMRFAGHDSDVIKLDDRVYNIGIIHTPRESLDRQAAQLEGAVPAVAWLKGDETVQVGVLGPEHYADAQAQAQNYTIGMGVNGGDLYATWGLYESNQGRFIAPTAGVTASPQVPTYSMAERHPGVVWV
jgi:hypothetical protein